MPLIEPGDDRPSTHESASDVVACFERRGVAKADARWLAYVALRVGSARHGEDLADEDVLELAQELADVYTAERESRDAAVLAVLLHAGRGSNGRADEELLRALLEPADPETRITVDLTEGVLRIDDAALDGENSGGVLSRLLVEPSPADGGRPRAPSARIALTRVLDLDRIREARFGGEVERLRDRRRLEFWLERAGLEVLSFLAPAFADEPGPTLARFAWGTLACIETWAKIKCGNLGRPEFLYALCARPLRPLFEVLHERQATASGDLELLGAYWLMASLALGRGEPASQATLTAVVDSARTGLGRLRSRLHGAASPGSAASLEADKVNYRQAVQALTVAGGCWAAMKALLLALRACAVPAVAVDLRFWKEAGRESPPEAFSWIAADLDALVHHYAEMEGYKDPGLAELRDGFATYCLERLKTRDGRKTETPGAGDLVEASADWRQCYIRAVRELRVNPRVGSHRRGHDILLWSSSHDPSPEVRQEAAIAAKELRRGVSLPDGTSPRRAVVAALWWCRQAHLAALGVKVDEAGARRTRQKEVRRTKEAGRPRVRS